ncbi:RHOMBOID-like protein 2 [Phragmites australis]|uniref:RHOMBOID-like protein 2 n=1 Tax=Phragmites australis TaxID=29695 RepID=UPI002D79B3B3|nr:RHOMBOID-like protein 2 [Phragmites australis]
MASRYDVEKGGRNGEGDYSAPAPAPGQYPQREGEREREWVPWFVPAIVAANIALFAVAMYVNNCPAHAASSRRGGGACVAGFLRRFSFQPLSENPLFGPSSATLQKLGALEWDKVVHEHQGWRLVTCIWLHAGVLHLLANMISLVLIGLRLEQQFGYVRIGIIYLVAGVGGSVLSSLFIRNNISVGASGALFGLLGAMLSELFTNWTIYANKAAALLTLLVVIAINLAIGILPHVDNFAHIGGFLTGFLLGFILLVRPHYGWMQRYVLPSNVKYTTKKYLAYQWVLLAVASILVVIGFAVGMGMLLRGVNANDHCQWCHYLSCVPTSRWSCGK